MKGADLFVALVLWGLWAFLPKLSQKHLGDPWSSVLYQVLGSVLVVLGLTVTRGQLTPVWNARGALFAALAGAAATAGMIFYYRACATNPVSVVAAMTALYPLVTILIAWPILGETLLPRQWLGAFLALVAAALLSPRP